MSREMGEAMSRRRFRTTAGMGVAVLLLTAMTAACTPPAPYAGPPTKDVSFAANSVTVNSSNDKGVCVFGVCVPPANDEPFVINVWFRMKIGVANSATTGVVTGDNAWPGTFDQGPGEGQSHTYTGGQQGTVNFSGMSTPDVGDLLQGAPVEIAGVWSWKMEADLIGVGSVATTAANALKTVLNDVLGGATLPSDASQIVSLILNALGGVGNGFATLASTIASIIPFGPSDDGMGSAFYIGVGASGTLSDIITSTAGSVAFPSIAIPVVSVPPDIGGGAIFSLGASHSFSNNYTNGGVSGQHTTSYTFG